MIGEGWVQDLTIVAATGDCTQVYPSWATVGDALSGATTGDTFRKPTGGKCTSLQIMTDATNGGTLELWDYSGFDDGIDVSAAATITNAQIVAAVAAGTAKLIHKQNYIASSETPVNIGAFSFQKGLVARVYNAGASGTCSLSLKVSGGVNKIVKI
jgi:hypothetical protein